MFRVNCTFIFLFFFITASAQSSFKKLSCPEKCWVICHPFKAKKAFEITKHVQILVDSIKKSGIIGVDNAGGDLDAFKHAYWMASLALKIGSKQARRLGKAHEKGNYFQFKKHSLEDLILPDSISSVMDLKNNDSGIELVAKSKNLSRTIVQEKVLEALIAGKLTIIKKDGKGNYLTCEGSVISLIEWAGKWNIPKCIVASFSH